VLNYTRRRISGRNNISRRATAQAEHDAWGWVLPRGGSSSPVGAVFLAGSWCRPEASAPSPSTRPCALPGSGLSPCPGSSDVTPVVTPSVRSDSWKDNTQRKNSSNRCIRYYSEECNTFFPVFSPWTWPPRWAIMFNTRCNLDYSGRASAQTSHKGRYHFNSHGVNNISAGLAGGDCVGGLISVRVSLAGGRMPVSS